MIKLPAVYRYYKQYKWVNDLTRENKLWRNVDYDNERANYIWKTFYRLL